MRKLNYFLIAVSCCYFFSCDNEDEPQVQEMLDISDPNVVSESIVIPNATIVEGTPPASSTDPDAPSLNESEDPFGAVSGNSFYLNPDINAGEIAGVYFQIDGAENYFDIPVTNSTGRFDKSNTGSRLFQNARRTNNGGVEIEIPENLEPGTFCAEYCVYDADGLVSNVVEICIEIISFGGENSDFLTANSWTLVSAEHTYDGQTETQEIGEDFSETHTIHLPCGPDTVEEVSVTEIHRINYAYLTFSNNGAYSFEESSFEKFVDFDNSTCQDVIYIEETDVHDEVGVWTYDHATQTLTVVTEGEEDGVAYTDIFKLNAQKVNDQLVLRIEEDEGETSELIFDVK
ncbi:hypothetical protein QQ008_00390 [Fulvivirgaceae bacterium BMA10]|uniref:Lipocalin-like domain-containing protein n=1 Tax=Splendidivirga corallicola TaxID=3051826 RepID=A0ABT8KGF7_9BACT|nr:hypothetical protein [Fulvivirgaceae bacterium BMA10]